MKYHALFVSFEKAAKFEIVVCGALWVKTFYSVQIYVLRDIIMPLFIGNL